ncbi:hypothetical protein F442_16718 [Phytophthora nicotianae P10297]|uniref:Uncharacterized protein n=3 Tax=Phytophthora nicotianae TaxID=4792 RepID=W2YK32_PHYNI|nr:hypothetical protein L915_16416 [Phytophthora nicotianae]ETP35038.1 hypothetical protein F442_16718 [Phytophthora nicotianae P10297]
MAEGQELIAVSLLSRHSRGRPLSRSGEAIKIFTDKVPVDQRFMFIRLLMTDPSAAIMFYELDDASREYIATQFYWETTWILRITELYTRAFPILLWCSAFVST